MLACLIVALANRVIDPLMVTRFGASETAAVRAWWASPDRFRVEDQNPGAPYVAAPTAEGSAWLLAYYKAFYPGQPVMPDRDPTPVTRDQIDANVWLRRRIDVDYAVAEQEAKALNEGREPLPDARADTPARVRQLVGEAPRFARPFHARRYTVALPDCTVFTADTPKTRREFPYLRTVGGVDIPGVATGESFWAAARRQVGANDQRGRVLQAVARLEGGFDTVNTYDTGRVSVGIVQFAAMAEGRGSLGSVLLAWRNADKAGFVKHLHRFGIDVTPDGALVVIDPATGWELHAAAAAWRVRTDARLAAVLSRAGRLSPGFQAAQVRTAIALFWPGDKRATWTTGGRTYTARLADVFRSDAGMATLLDRSVNTGDVSTVLNVVQGQAVRSGARSAADLAVYEGDFVRALRYRQDFTAVAGLSKPGAAVASSRPAPPPLPGTTAGPGVLRPANPLAWEPHGGTATTPAAPPREETAPQLPEGADPKVAIPLGPPPEPRKPEDFESPLKKKPVEKPPKQNGG
ncbi:MAG: hypothetical protein KF857_04945 [Fimbriimonadaceae bacterium]|nr:hypothetical protein [Fimbriimonadaceae bacterium]